MSTETTLHNFPLYFSEAMNSEKMFKFMLFGAKQWKFDEPKDNVIAIVYIYRSQLCKLCKSSLPRTSALRQIHPSGPMALGMYLVKSLPNNLSKRLFLRASLVKSLSN